MADSVSSEYKWEDSRIALQRLLRKGLEYCVQDGTMTEAEASNYHMAGKCHRSCDSQLNTWMTTMTIVTKVLLYGQALSWPKLVIAMGIL